LEEIQRLRADVAHLETALALRVDEIKHLRAELDTCDGGGECGRVQGRYERKQWEKKRKKHQ